MAVGQSPRRSLHAPRLKKAQPSTLRSSLPLRSRGRRERRGDGGFVRRYLRRGLAQCRRPCRHAAGLLQPFELFVEQHRLTVSELVVLEKLNERNRRPGDVGTGSGLQDPRRRQPLRRRRQLLRVVHGGQPDADDHRERPARGGPDRRAPGYATRGHRARVTKSLTGRVISASEIHLPIGVPGQSVSDTMSHTKSPRHGQFCGRECPGHSAWTDVDGPASKWPIGTRSECQLTVVSVEGYCWARACTT